jgi:SAM-dependent methyltransferase
VTEPHFLREARASYDTIAAEYQARFGHELTARPLDRGMLAGFAGRVAAYLASLGVSVSGIDLSSQMVAVARDLYPALRFEVGSMLDLDLPDASLGGVLAWYSTIHVPDDRLPDAFAEFHRVLAPVYSHMPI